MAMTLARNIATQIKQHPLFDPTDETRFIAAHIFELINPPDQVVTELLWSKVLAILFDSVNLFYDLPEECQYHIYKHLFRKECLTPLIENGYDLTTGPIIERALALGTFRRGRSGKKYICRCKAETDFYNKTTADIRLHNYIFDYTGDHVGDALFPSDTEGQSPMYYKLMKIHLNINLYTT